MVNRERVTGTLDGEFVVFLIGMRINRPGRVGQWVPVIRAMGRMLRELHARPELGFLHAETWFGRTTLMLQYWRSAGQLLEYAKNRDAQHLPAWRAFNQRTAANGAVGIWHETYLISPGQYETMYVNMPQFGLARAGTPRRAHGALQSAVDRLAWRSGA